MPRPYYVRKNCYFCRKKIDVIDFKDTATLNRYLTGWAKIKPGRDTGTCTKHQRRMREAIKRSRFMAILPYVKR